MLAEVHVASSLISGGATDMIKNFSSDALATTTDFLGIVIPGSLAIWAAKTPIVKGVNWLKSQVFRR